MPALHVGVLIDHGQVAAWQAAAIRALLDVPGVQLPVIIRRRPDRDGAAGDGPGLFAWYRDRDRAKHAPPAALDPLAPVQVDDLLASLAPPPAQLGVGDAAELERVVAAAGLHALLDLTAGAPARSLARGLDAGLWRFGFADDAGAVEPPLGFWEVARDEPVVVSALHRLGVTPQEDRVLYRSVGASNRFSVRKTINDQLWKAATFAARAASRLLASDGRKGSGAVETVAPARPTRPSAIGMASFLTRLVVRRLVNRARDSLFEEQWMIAYRLAEATGTPHTAESALGIAEVVRDGAHGFRAMVPPRDRYWADPFPYLADGRYFLFFEEVPRSDNKGRIVVVEILPDGSHDAPRTVLERPYHLSYPFVFAWEGETWMVPESGANRTVELYRAVRFPDVWELDRVLLDDVAACDATIFRDGDRWWMTVTIAPERSEAYWDELHLFEADSPLGPWRRASDVPVKSDTRNSRPAGRVVRTPDGLLRPAQDCSRGYGYAIVLHRIETLGREAFVEREVGRLLPTWYPGLIGTHTINATGRLTAIDGKLLRRRFP